MIEDRDSLVHYEWDVEFGREVFWCWSDGSAFDELSIEEFLPRILLSVDYVAGPAPHPPDYPLWVPMEMR